MKLLLVLATIALTIVCWGVYGPVLKRGQEGFSVQSNEPGAAAPQGDHASRALRSFICVGLAYFLIAVVVPVTMLKTYGENGSWTASGMFWSLLAGAAGALGALGVLLALVFGGQPLYIMPLVFGGAPVVNAALTMYMGRTLKEVGPLFLTGLIMVLLGSVVVLFFGQAGKAGQGITQRVEQLAMVLTFVTLAILSWGAYGPVLHRGQTAMGSSRLRPLICVGLAYFLIAVLVPGLMLATGGEGGQWTFGGTLWSVGAGAAGAIGALGIIMCFNFGGRPIYVMPLVFGGAPVVNTLIAAAVRPGGLGGLSPMFYAGLILTCAGAVFVLVFAPKAHPPAAK
jgi:hypothetical protein